MGTVPFPKVVSPNWSLAGYEDANNAERLTAIRRRAGLSAASSGVI
jgi:hypothetical protein